MIFNHQAQIDFHSVLSEILIYGIVLSKLQLLYFRLLISVV